MGCNQSLGRLSAQRAHEGDGAPAASHVHPPTGWRQSGLFGARCVQQDGRGDIWHPNAYKSFDTLTVFFFFLELTYSGVNVSIVNSHAHTHIYTHSCSPTFHHVPCPETGCRSLCYAGITARPGVGPLLFLPETQLLNIYQHSTNYFLGLLRQKMR